MTDAMGKKVWEKTTDITATTFDLEATINKPQMWWPNIVGEHPLYYFTAILYDD